MVPPIFAMKDEMAEITDYFVNKTEISVYYSSYW
jgi:hypothetical protein